MKPARTAGRLAARSPEGTIDERFTHPPLDPRRRRAGLRGGGGPHLFHPVAPQAAQKPYVVLVGSRTEEEYGLAGTSGLTDGAVNVVVVGPSFTSVENAGNAIADALKNYTGTVAEKSVIIFRRATDLFDYVPAENAHRRILGFRVSVSG